VQKAAAAIFTGQGQVEIKKVIRYYMENASMMIKGFSDMGFKVYGGTNAPYVWVKTKNNMKSWEFFDLLLNNAYIVGTPGSGFGPSGEGYFRFSAFADKNNVVEAIDRIKRMKF
jgi:LL-diaminopimelate aminotransferase